MSASVPNDLEVDPVAEDERGLKGDEVREEAVTSFRLLLVGRLRSIGLGRRRRSETVGLVGVIAVPGRDLARTSE